MKGLIRMRHPEYEYRIGHVTRDTQAWIFILDNKSGWSAELSDWTSDEQFSGPMEFLKRIHDREHWNFVEHGVLQYCFIEDPYHVIFQMDDLYGFVAIVNDNLLYKGAIEFLQKYMIV